MSLNVDFTKCKANADHPLASTVAMTSMVIAVGDLTEKTINEWLRRAAVLQAMDGPWLHTAGEDGKKVDIYLTRKHVEPFIGMKTNVSPEKAASWNKRMKEAAWRKVGEKAARILANPETEVLRRW